MELINDLGTDLAVAFLVERRYQQKLDSEEARALISRVKDLLESSEATEDRRDLLDETLRRSAH
ncbi:MAG TPA: hypothetical protein VJV05_17880 [Pyrinomonadaceae bacterium]|nr:hypothetical protein [Pyrinomonadaceae bacterium]